MILSLIPYSALSAPPPLLLSSPHSLYIIITLSRSRRQWQCDSFRSSPSCRRVPQYPCPDGHHQSTKHGSDPFRLAIYPELRRKGHERQQLLHTTHSLYSKYFLRVHYQIVRSMKPQYLPDLNSNSFVVIVSSTLIVRYCHFQ